MAGRWLSTELAAEYLTTTVGGLRRLMREGKVPPPWYRLGPMRARWDREALDAAMRAALVGRYSTVASVVVVSIRQEALSKPRKARHEKS